MFSTLHIAAKFTYCPLHYLHIYCLLQSNSIEIKEDDLRARFSVCDTDKSGDLDREEYEEFYAKTKVQNSILEKDANARVNHEKTQASYNAKKRFVNVFEVIQAIIKQILFQQIRIQYSGAKDFE